MDGKIIFFNESAGKMLGYNPEKAIAKNIKELIANTRLLQVISSRKPELRQKHKIDKKTFLVNSRYNLDPIITR
jgi:PAS domain S-box-containing protein